MVRPQLSRTIGAALLTGVLAVGLSACSTPQTLQPYTPAEGVNADVTDANASTPLKVRNLLVVKPASGNAFLSGAILAPVDKVVPDGTVTRRVPAPADALVRVEGTALSVHDAPEASLQAVQPNLELPPGQMVVLTQQPAITIAGGDLRPGLLVKLKLTFRSGQSMDSLVPIIDGSKANYAGMTPMPAAKG